MDGFFADKSAFKEPVERVDLIAASTKVYKAGNCGEQAAFAFVHLRDTNIRPIDLCRFVDRDYDFVVLDAAAPITPDNFGAWTPGAMVCDP